MTDYTQFPPPPGPQVTLPPLAGWGRRAVAALIDMLFALAVVSAFVFVANRADFLGFDWGEIGFVLWLGFVALYYPLLMRRTAAHNGQTWGKQALRVRVIREDGAPITGPKALMREFVIKWLLLVVVGGIGCLVPALLDALWPTWDDRNQSLHDLLAHTLVVKT